MLILGREWLLACGEPSLRLQFVITHQRRRQAVGESPSDEVVFSILLPVRKIAFANRDFLLLLEEGRRCLHGRDARAPFHFSNHLADG